MLRAMCLLRAYRRRRWMMRPLPAEWREILEQRVPFHRWLPESKRARFEGLLQAFAHEKYFVPAGGMEIDDTVRVIISACAARLILHRDLSYYDRLTEIVVYPHDYKHKDDDGRILGEAHHWGVVVLSWSAVLRGINNPYDGHATAAHEFAHVLDRGGGAFDGTPTLDRLSAYEPWAVVMSDHYERLQRRGPKVRKVLRPYGATNEAEFFAVATESYFEKPTQMLKQTPELYREMQLFYGGDPAATAVSTSVQDDLDPWHDVGRNDDCPCGSAKKFKRCCGRS